ncbi:MAG: hypothetical protein J1F31_03465 [Erysipelotrichales bacterium]|nr:hypothetical protein [Erysipelotrichales bacterium]
MKKTAKIMISLIALIGLSSCDMFAYYLPKPKDTNLELWITEKVSSDKLETLTLMPKIHGENIYLGSSYSPNEDGMLNSMPSIYVAYRITNYPNTSSDNISVTYIEITDPEITFYGITLGSTFEEIENSMKKEKFKIEYTDQGYLNASKKNIEFSFYGTSIRITAFVNNDQVVEE